MAFSDIYRQQAALLIRLLPYVAEEEDFALKGGTAINLFVRNMPRLSVDIDLAYLPVQERKASLEAIDAALERVSGRILKAVPGAHVHPSQHEGATTKLVVRSRNVQTIIEVTPVLRGCVYEPEVRAVAAGVEEAFGFAEIKIVSFADLYAGKIVAALDRQHPRDLFDVRELLAGEGIDDAIRQALVVYLLSHGRPMFALLAPTRKDISQDFRRGFTGMASEPVSQDSLEKAREELIADVVGKMPKDHRRFLMSFEEGEPEWALLKVPGAKDLPAVKWRKQKLDELSAEKRKSLIAGLEKVFGEKP
jgi:predicted nucleotidyltransferase component of viral defense system